VRASALVNSDMPRVGQPMKDSLGVALGYTRLIAQRLGTRPALALIIGVIGQGQYQE